MTIYWETKLLQDISGKRVEILVINAIETNMEQLLWVPDLIAAINIEIVSATYKTLDNGVYKKTCLNS